MRHTLFHILILALTQHCSSLFAQGTPLPQQGSVVAEYASLKGNSFQLLGFDLATRARFIVHSSPSGSYEIRFVDRNGNTLEGEAGESILLPADSDSSTVPVHAFADAFPFLLSELIPQLPDEVVTVEAQPDGTTIYSCQLISGGLGLTIHGLPEGFESASREIRYTFSGNGKLLSKHDVSNDILEEVTYAESDCPQLAIPSSYANGNWVLVNIECFDTFPADIFDADYITARARNMLVSYNNRSNETRSAMEAEESAMKDKENLSGGMIRPRTKQWALIITGLIVISVGSLAWWKNRW